MVAELEFLSYAKELLDIQEKLYDLNMKRRYVEKVLREKLDNKTYEACGYKYETTGRVGAVIYEDIPELKSVDLEQYRGAPVNVWRLSYHKQFDI